MAASVEEVLSELLASRRGGFSRSAVLVLLAVRLRSCRVGLQPIVPALRFPKIHSSTTQATHTRLLSRTLPSRYLSTTSPRTDIQKPTPRINDEIIASPAPPSILDRLPGFAKPLKPYLELTRIDKPIGTLLLYWPCGEPSSNARVSAVPLT